jgi:benzoylformate decarboxylase
MSRMTGKHALAQMLIAEGTEHIFGNPGTSETPFLDGLQDYPQIKYVQALQEGTAVGMADGYARASGRPAFANIHIAGGLANGISALYNAYRGGTPVVLTAGNSDTRMLLSEPTLSGDLVQMTHQYTKWSHEIHHAADIPAAVRRAFNEAKTPPTGPTFLSFPWDTMDVQADVDIIGSGRGYHRIRPDRDALERASQLLAQAENPVIIIGDRIAQSGGVEQMVQVAERLGAKVFAASFSEVNFPTSHPLWSGMLNTSSPAVRRLLSGADVALAVGANIFSSFLYVDVPLLDPTTKLVHLDSATSEVEKTYPTEIGVFSDPATGLAELADALDQDMSASAKEAATTRMAELGERRRRAREDYQQRLRQRWDNNPMAVERMMHELAAAAPPGTIVADEAVTSRPAMMQEFSFDEPGTFFGIQGGALGWAMPGALGLKLAKPDRPVLAVVGDGASMYTVQALWTAATFNIPVVYAICNNRAYRILKVNMDIYLKRMLNDDERVSEYKGMDFANPLDLSAVARGLGVASEKITDPSQIGPSARRMFESGKPGLLDINIDGSL